MTDEAGSPAAGELGARLNEILASEGLAELDAGLADRFGAYAALLMRWNARMNLTAVRDADGILRRHFTESIVCARALPAGIATLLDLGSGAGFPGIPVALCRAEIRVTLAESQGKKAAFLREVGRVLGLAVAIHGGRAEDLAGGFDCVTLRAVERMAEAVRIAERLVNPGGWLAVLTTTDDEGALAAVGGGRVLWGKGISVAEGTRRVLLLGRRAELEGK